MTSNQHDELRKLEGRMVHVALAGGSRLDDVELISARCTTCWLFVNGEDVFVPVNDVIDIWESKPFRSAA